MSTHKEPRQAPSSLTRRQFLTRALAVGVPLLAWACGGKAPVTGKATRPSGVTGKPTASTQAPAPAASATSATTPASTAPISATTTATSGASSLAPILSPTVFAGKPTGGEFHASWPTSPPPQGQFNTFISYALPSGIGIYYPLQEMPLAMYNWSREAFWPMLATSWEVVPPDTFRIHLRQNVKWSDGKPFTSKDVVTTFLITWMLNYPMWNYLGSVTADDDHTVTLKMKKPSTVVPYYVLETNIRADSLYGSWAQKAKALMDKGLDASSKQVSSLVTQFNKYKLKDAPVTGPYKIDPKTITSAQMTLNKVPTAWNADQVNFDKIVVYNMNSIADVMPQELTHEIDFATYPFTTAQEKALKKAGVDIVRPPALFGCALNINFKQLPEFGDARARQALMHAIDRKQNGAVSLGESSVPPKWLTGVPDEIIEHWLTPEELNVLPTYDYDQDKAAKLFEQAGWKRKGGTWYTPQGKQASYSISSITADFDLTAGAQNAVEQLNDFGFKLKLLGKDPDVFAGLLTDGNYEIAAWEWGTGQPHPYFSYVFDLFSYNDNGSGKKGMAFPMKQNVPGLGQVDLKQLVIESAAGLDRNKQREIVLKLAKAYAYLVPQIVLWERYGDAPLLRNVRVIWPPSSDPLWKQPLYSDSYVTLWILNGTLKGTGKSK